MLITVIGALFANLAVGNAGNNLCSDSILSSAYDKGYSGGIKFYDDNTNNSQKQQDKIGSIAADLNGQTVSDTTDGIAFCTQLGYVDALVSKSRTPSASFLALFDEQTKDRVCASLKSKIISAGCVSKADKAGSKKDFGYAESVEVELVGGSVRVSISDDDKVYLTTTFTAGNSKIESTNTGTKVTISEKIEGSSGEGNTKILIAVPKGIHLKLKSVNGGIDITGIPRDLNVDTVSGDIHVKFDNGNLEGKANIDSVRGNIYLRYADGFKYSGKIRSVNGSIYGKPDFKDDAKYVLRSGSVSGNIYINK
ncbi:MAG: DUF4097 family beta strand repeat protein [Deltaproteobacteria bacterium]|nr:DUF4097 family beta strand repeat protein [Deltaproteobacteria bacterium]